MEDTKIKSILLEEGYVSEEDIKKAEQSEEGLLDFLFHKNVLTKEIFGQAMAEHFKVNFRDLVKEKIEDDALHLIPEAVARAKEVVIFSKDEKIIKIGMTNPDDLVTKHLIEKRVTLPVKVYYITPQDLASTLELYSGSIKNTFDDLLAQVKDESLDRDARDELMVNIVDQLLEYGYTNKASDIHIEPYRESVEVRFRIDGVMHNVLKIPKDLHELILTRIKILAKMRTDEHRAAQDGKLRFKVGKEPVDVRVSVVPIVEGENIVMRLLSAKSRQFSLPGLGFSNNNLDKVKRAIKNPHGMVLVTGPTGSGKTTTLYAVLKILNKSSIHVSTIEDPVEYDIEGVSQIQVNPKTNLTFAKGLRALVRQDPDIIMVGEIRDSETAGIAINSALTGHLVLSTLHTNDAVTTLPRLIDMEVEPFLVASTVNVVIAQRLVRKICQSCRVSFKLNKEQKRSLEHQKHISELIKKVKNKEISQINFYKGTGCKVCGNTGYLGRAGLFEVLEMTDEVRELVNSRASSDELNKKAREQGMQSMLEDGLEKVLNGETTLEEVLRVAKD
jgi:type II secretory ATPase GspE/PulE/Tfp pilus assembly ATPase PilB-like protein